MHKRAHVACQCSQCRHGRHTSPFWRAKLHALDKSSRRHWRNVERLVLAGDMEAGEAYMLPIIATPMTD